MPKLFGLNLLAVLVASVAFFFVGFLWYGVLFTKAWLAAYGITPDPEAGESPIWMVGGFVITIVEAFGIGLVLKWKGAVSLGGAVATAIALWFCFALPLLMYNYLYLPGHNATILMIDASHLLVGWVVSAAVLSLMKV